MAVIITDKLEVDGGILLPPSLHRCSKGKGISSQSKLHSQKGEKLKQGCDVTGDRTWDLTHQRQRTCLSKSDVDLMESQAKGVKKGRDLGIHPTEMSVLYQCLFTEI